jgi:hypothetical protein
MFKPLDASIGDPIIDPRGVGVFSFDEYVQLY